MIHVVNAHDHADWRDSGYYQGHRYLFTFGVYGAAHVLVYEQSIEDALEGAAEVVLQHAPGLLSEPEYEDALEEEGLACLPGGMDTLQRFLNWRAEEASPDGRTWNDVFCAVTESAEADMTYTESGWLASWFVDEDPSRETLVELGRRLNGRSLCPR